MKNEQERDLFDHVFSAKDFTRTLSYREFLTSFSLVLLLVALFRLVDYYANETWVENNQQPIKWIFLIILLPANHVFYKIEHTRSNNFIGRNLHDYIFLLLFAAIQKLSFTLMGQTWELAIEGVGGLIFFLLGMMILVILFEIAVSLIKRLLTLFRWQVL